MTAPPGASGTPAAWNTTSNVAGLPGISAAVGDAPAVPEPTVLTLAEYQQIAERDARRIRDAQVVSPAPSADVLMALRHKGGRVTQEELEVTYTTLRTDAWAQELERVKLGFHGLWSASERDELLRSREVRGWRGEEIHSVHKFPALMGQASNIRFVRETSSQSRVNML